MCTILVSNSFEVCLPTCLLFPPPAPWFNMYSMCMHAHMTVHRHMHHMYVDMHTYVYMRMHSMYRRSVGGEFAGPPQPGNRICFRVARACVRVGGRQIREWMHGLFSRRFRPPSPRHLSFSLFGSGGLPLSLPCFRGSWSGWSPGFWRLSESSR